MIVSRTWLGRYFDAPLPDIQALADALTFHAFEVEEIKEDTFDVKVLPNRAPDCLSHRGIARELSAILDITAKPDVLREFAPAFPKTDALTVAVEDARACPRYMGALMRGVKVGQSPAWLKEALESVGQRSINNVVDATNFVMLDIEQPLHAFDAARLTEAAGTYAIKVRGAKEGEKITILSGEEYILPPGTLLITDAHADRAIGIAGIKGGKPAEITETTTDIIIESANFDGTMVRKASQLLKLWTDAGKRFQNNLSPEFPAYGMKAVIDLILEIAGGELIGVTDHYPAPIEPVQVPCSLGRINHTLGTSYSGNEVESVLKRLGLAYRKTAEDFTIDPPFERRDISIPQDIVEEVGRIMGYDKVPSVALPALDAAPDQARFHGIEKMKDQLIEQGFTEVSTQSFAKKGDIALANPLDSKMPMLRTTLEDTLNDALARAKLNAPLVLPPNVRPKLFEVGTVFPKEGEFVELRMTETVPAWGENFPTHDNLSIAKLEDYGKDYEPKRYQLGMYKPFSIYPFIVRDIALWVPAGTESAEVEKMIRDAASELLVRLDQFDRFEKDNRVSYAFRLIFQSPERTLTDDEANGTMEKVTDALVGKGYEVR